MERFYILVTALGNPEVILSIFAFLFVVVLINHRKHIVKTFLGALLTGIIVAFAVKEYIQSPRPYSDLLLYSHGYSFPSAHALIATVTYGFIGFYLWRLVGTRLARIAGVVIGVGIPFLVGLSRLYLGVHRTIDVVAGWGIGAIILASWIVHLVRAQRRETYQPHLSRLSHLFLFLVIVSEVVFISVSLYFFQSRIPL